MFLRVRMYSGELDLTGISCLLLSCIVSRWMLYWGVVRCWFLLLSYSLKGGWLSGACPARVFRYAICYPSFMLHGSL
jgi:hypothetical protein